MKTYPTLVAAVLLTGLAACTKQANPPAAGATPSPATVPTAAAPTSNTPAAATVASHGPADGIAWRKAATDADVDAAFLQARTDGKPVFLYWGASWCPPCNQVKATLFNRQDFIERSRAFVPVYVDGDAPGAQKLGARFRVSGYPTMLLMRNDGTELTRLPGEVDPAQYLEVVTLGMNAKRPVKDVLGDALSGQGQLAPADWRLLAFYSWDTDEQQLVKKAEVPGLLKRLSAACPTSEAETATRLWLKALAATDAKAPPPHDAALADRLVGVLDNPSEAKAQYDVLVNYADDLARAASARGTPARTKVIDAFERTLVRFESDASLSNADRIGAAIGRVALARIDETKPAPAASGAARQRPALAPALLGDVRTQAARVDRDITDGYERQAVISSAAYLLDEAGLRSESDNLLKANLAKSHSPYYLMLHLASNARKHGDTTAALQWYEEAYARSEGPATRLQWGSSYLDALVDLAPRDEARIENVTLQLLDEAAKQPDAFYERSGRSLQKVGTKLQKWNSKGEHKAALKRLQARVDEVCATLPAGEPPRARCEGLLKADAGKPA